MPRDVYSLRIFATGALTNAAGTVGPIVPSGLVYVVRDIDAFASTNAVNDQLVIFGQTLGILWAPIVRSSTQDQNWSWRGRQVYNEGEQVGVHAFTGTWAVHISGYQLTLP